MFECQPVLSANQSLLNFTNDTFTHRCSGSRFAVGWSQFKELLVQMAGTVIIDLNNSHWGRMNTVQVWLLDLWEAVKYVYSDHEMDSI